MRVFTGVLIGAQILLTVGGQVLWKRSMGETGGFMLSGQSLYASLLRSLANPLFLIGTALYVCATLLWFYLLSRFKLSFIYPFLSLTYVVSFIFAWLFLRETIGIQRWIAVGLISLGVFLALKS